MRASRTPHRRRRPRGSLSLPLQRSVVSIQPNDQQQGIHIPPLAVVASLNLSQTTANCSREVPSESTCHSIPADSAGLKTTFVGNQWQRFPARAKFTNIGTMALPTDAGCPKVTPADNLLTSAATGESVIILCG